MHSRTRTFPVDKKFPGPGLRKTTILNFLRTTNSCNQNCVFCKVRKSDVIVPLSRLRDRLTRIKESGGNTVIFTGGEPTLRGDLPELISIAKNLGLKVRMQTNAIKLSDAGLTEEIVNSGLDSVLVSSHSHQRETLRKMTRSPDTLTEVMRGIGNLSTHDIELGVSVIFTTLNYREVPEHLRFLVRRFTGIDYIHLSSVFPIGETAKNPQTVVKFSEIELPLYESMDFLRGQNINFVSQGIPLCFMVGSEHHSAELQRMVGCVGIENPGHRLIKLIDELPQNRRESAFGRVDVKSKKCSLCSLERLCAGVWEKYPQIHGDDEFKPSGRSPLEVIKNIKEHYPSSPLTPYFNPLT